MKKILSLLVLVGALSISLGCSGSSSSQKSGPLPGAPGGPTVPGASGPAKAP